MIALQEMAVLMVLMYNMVLISVQKLAIEDFLFIFLHLLILDTNMIIWYT